MPLDPPPDNAADPATTIVPDGNTIGLPGGAAAKLQITGYEVLGELGRGGMGVVYRARQISLDRIVALKILLAGQHANAALHARFRAEAEVVAKLQHPNIVQVYEVAATQGCPYLSLEFVNGGSLADKLQDQPLTFREAAGLVRTLALAVQAAHDAGVIHRDLKPANILLTLDGTPKITDFGLAKQLSGNQAVTQTGDIMGTPSYMAPEQASGVTKNIGPPCDVYALGAMFYELLTGGPPFRGRDPMDTVLLVLSQEPIAVRRIAPKTPRDLETICLKCIEKLPAKRYPTARDLADDLARYLEGRPIQARPTSRTEKVWKWARRRPALAALIVVSLASLATIISYGAWKNWQLNEALNAAVEARSQTEKALETAVNARNQSENNVRRAINSSVRRITRSSDSSANPLLEELEFLEKVRTEPGDDPEIQVERALAARWVGYIDSQLDDAAAAEKAFAESISQSTRLTQQFPHERSYRSELANAINQYGAALARLGDNAGAKRQYVKAVAILEALLAEEPRDPDVRYLLGACYNNVGALGGEPSGTAEEWHHRALKVRQALVDEFPENSRYQHDLTVTEINLAAGKLSAKRFAEAEDVLRGCLKALAAAPKKVQADEAFHRAVVMARLDLGIALESQNKLNDALAQYAAAVHEMELLVEANPLSVPLRAMLLDALHKQIGLQFQLAAYQDAIATDERLIQLYSQLVKEFPDNHDYADKLTSHRQTLDQIRDVAAKPPAKP